MVLVWHSISMWHIHRCSILWNAGLLWYWFGILYQCGILISVALSRIQGCCGTGFVTGLADYWFLTRPIPVQLLQSCWIPNSICCRQYGICHYSLFIFVAFSRLQGCYGTGLADSWLLFDKFPCDCCSCAGFWTAFIATNMEPHQCGIFTSATLPRAGHFHDIHLASLKLFIQLYTAVILSYSCRFNTVEVCSLHIYVRKHTFTLDMYK